MDDDLFIPGANEREIAIRRRVHRLAEFYRHAVTFLIINALLWSLNAWLVFFGTMPNRWYVWWAVWPTLGWGIGLLCHGITVMPFWNLFSDEWEERKVREILERNK